MSFDGGTNAYQELRREFKIQINAKRSKDFATNIRRF